MRSALAFHDSAARSSVAAHRGEVVKMTGDGIHAVFADPLDALLAGVKLQLAMAEAEARFGFPLRIRCGVHAGRAERRDNDYYGAAVNRAARIMSAAHGGQMLLSGAAAERIGDRLPPEVALRDLGEVRLRDLAEPERVFQVVHSRLRAEFPALRSVEGAPSNLPHALTTFIGRERELDDVKAQLRLSRLVTLVGMGGVGKTRLALEAARGIVGDFRDGAWLVELAATRDPRSVVQAIATALRVQESGGLGVEESLLAYARQRTLLIVLDNCEHLLEAAARAVHRLLSACPEVRVLATSREALGVSGEALQPLSGLAVPGPLAAVDARAAMGSDSVRLFVDRAAAVNPSFEGTAQAAEIAAICHRLDGIPLAIELAAARARSLSVRQIALRLDDRFRLLAGRDPNLLPKQRTLRALIDWSYDLLPEDERALFARLCVFAGGWTPEAAESVCGGPALEADRVLECVTRLADKSLVVADAGCDRFHMLETVREYAQSRLAESGAENAVRERHLAFFLELAQAARAGLTGPDQAQWLSRLDQERENLLAAHDWCGASPDNAERGLALVSALKFYWISRGLLELGRRVTLEALARPGAAGAGMPRARGLFNAGQLAYVMGRYAEARGHLEESLAIVRQAGDEKAIAAALQPLGMSALGQNDLAAAHAYLEEAVALARGRADRRELAAALNALAQLRRVEGAHDRAIPLYEEVLEIARALGDRESEAIVQLNRAMVALAAGELEAARAMLGEAIELAQPLQSPRLDQCLLDGCAALAALCGEPSRAARLFAGAESCARRTGLRRDPADDAFLAPLAAAVRASAPAEADGDYEEAALALGEARDWISRRPPDRSPYR